MGDYIKIDMKGTGCESVKWLQLAQGKAQ